MNPHTQRTIAVASVTLLLASQASAGAEPAVAIPDNLRAPPGEALAHAIAATGVQIYECGPHPGDPARHEWVFRGPEAELFDPAGRRIGRHYAGPTWESEDGSKVVGAVTARADGPEPGAIPWLLLDAKATSGTGMFAETASIQRVLTVGGSAPAEPCSAALAGTVRRVGYTATYYFYAARP